MLFIANMVQLISYVLLLVHIRIGIANNHYNDSETSKGLQ